MTPFAVLFDFFGTLVDYPRGPAPGDCPRSYALLRGAGLSLSPGALAAAWEAVSREAEEAAERSLREYSMVDFAARVLGAVGLGDREDGLAERLADVYVDEWSAGVRYSADVVAMVRRLATRLPVGIVSNTHHPSLVPSQLRRMGIAKHVSAVVLSVEVGVRKPHPRLFHAALERLGAASAVFVGDSYEADYLGAVGAGLDAFLIGDGQAPADRRLAAVTDLESRLAEAGPGDGGAGSPFA